MTIKAQFIHLALFCGLAAIAHADEANLQAQKTWTEEAQIKLQATYQNLQFDKVGASEIPGLLEIYTAGKMLYFSPEKELLLIGEMFTANGVSLTEQKIATYAAERAGDIDRNAALVIGEGTREVIAFVDPDCSYCRQANAWFQAQAFPDLRELIYFMPLKGRQQAEARALGAVCASRADRPAALARAFDTSRTADSASSEQCPDGPKQLARHAEIARSVGVYATPFFIIDGEVVAGFDKTRLTELLGKPQAPAMIGAR